MYQLKQTKTHHKMHFTLEANSYMFRHQGSIFNKRRKVQHVKHYRVPRNRHQAFDSYNDLPFRFFDYNCLGISHRSHACYMTCLPLLRSVCIYLQPSILVTTECEESTCHTENESRDTYE
jgi:hypothetical protein